MGTDPKRWVNETLNRNPSERTRNILQKCCLQFPIFIVHSSYSNKDAVFWIKTGGARLTEILTNIFCRFSSVAALADPNYVALSRKIKSDTDPTLGL